MSARIRAMTQEDGEAVMAVYREGIATGHATFETGAPSWDDWDAAHIPTCRLVAERAGRIVGFTALTAVSRRQVYRGVGELSIFVAAGARGAGIGRALLEALVAASEAEGYWTLQAGIFPENEASLALHRACGFRVVGTRERIGQRDGAWRDVVLLERRSTVAGR
ncbi:MAG TPA: GNAT family N-acetyltransferase [Candidatus Polarisedimenticolaceae bacterium]|nr:GNAT family N-acetyltransferase [Candidatus Polarisedimenticolaceae bacterium]